MKDPLGEGGGGGGGGGGGANWGRSIAGKTGCGKKIGKKYYYANPHEKSVQVHVMDLKDALLQLFSKKTF